MELNAAVLEKADPQVKAYIQELNQQWTIRYESLQEELRLALHQRFGRSSEKIPDQPELFGEAEDDASEMESKVDNGEVLSVPAHARKKPGRKPIDPNLPREEVLHDISEEEKKCACGCQKVRIGEDVREIVCRRPAEIWVEKHIMLRYACHECEGSGDEDNPAVIAAKGPVTLLPRSIASNSLLAFILVNKYVDHLPFYRQEKRFERMGIYISRQDMSNWTIAAARKMEPLIELFKEILKDGPLIQMDETRVQVMKELGKADTTQSFMWLARGGPPGNPVCLYHYSKNRGSDYPRLLLDGYHGYIQSDGYEVYALVAAEQKEIVLAGCWAHARRKFHEAAKAKKGKPGAAHQGLGFIQKLYRIENTLRASLGEGKIDDASFVLERRSQTEKELTNFRIWLDKKAETVVPSSLLGKAVSYTLKQWDKLIRYLDIAELTPDNNRAENAIRPFVLGRKNWLFSGSPRGADSSCAIYSILETARQNNLNPFDYLNFIFERIPFAESKSDWQALLPSNLTPDQLKQALPS